MVDPINRNYTINKVLHDQISIFKFVVADDGETIIHYSKLYGCRPQGVPRDTFSDLNPSNGLRYSISWKAAFVEDMDPLILYDFNELTKKMISGKKDAPIFDVDLDGTSTWASVPYIVRQDYDTGKNPNSYVYKLKWKG